MKKILNFLILLFFIFLLYEVMINKRLVNETILLSFDLWKNKLFPILFPTFIISEFLINYGFAYYLSIILNYPFKKLFKINGLGAFVFILSIISGFPSSAKYIKDLYDKNLINSNEATKLLMFTHFSNPLFIISFINNFIDFKYCIIILISHYIPNIIIGILFRNLYKCINYKTSKLTQNSFNYVFKNSITNAINTLLLILGTISFFMIITIIINNLNINSSLKLFFNSILEMTNGIRYIGNLNLSILNKTILFTMILSFGGISVHFQVLSILENTKIKYQLYLISRIIHSLISGILVFILFNFV